MAGNNLMPTGTADTFTGSNGAAFNSTNWTTSLLQGSGGGVTIQGNQGRLATGTVTGNRTSVRLNTAARLDQEVVFDWVVPAAGAMFPFCWVRANSSIDTASGYYITLDPADMELGYAETTSTYNRVAIVTYTHGFTAGQLVRTRFAVFGGTGTKTLKVRTWLASNQEPSTWQISTTDTHVVNTNGVIGFSVASGSAGSKNFFIDNVDLYDAETSSQKTVVINGSITAAGTLMKRIPKTFTGSVTPAGTLVKLRVVIQAFTGSITAAGALLLAPRKSFSGSITAAGVMARRANKVLSGSITATGALQRFVRRAFSGSITAVGTLVIAPLGRVFGVPGVVVVTVRKAGELRARFRRT